MAEGKVGLTQNQAGGGQRDLDRVRDAAHHSRAMVQAGPAVPSPPVP